jgi:hypothetical protein
MREHALGVSSCPFRYVGGDFDAVTPLSAIHMIGHGLVSTCPITIDVDP